MRLTQTALGLALFVAIAGAGCAAHADGPPEIVLDRDACSRCGMLISEARHAAALRAPDGSTRLFDDIGCLRTAVGGASDGLRVWVHDASDGSWLDGREATFVLTADVSTPMAGGVLAYRRTADAERAAAQHHGRTVRSVTDLFATPSTGAGS